MAPTTRSTSRPVIGVTEARQARLGRPILWVLLCSLALVVIGFAAAYAWHAGDFARAHSQHRESHAVAARTFNAPEPAAINPQPYQDQTNPSTNHTQPTPTRPMTNPQP